LRRYYDDDEYRGDAFTFSAAAGGLFPSPEYFCIKIVIEKIKMNYRNCWRKLLVKLERIIYAASKKICPS
jgi:hypothetical protein